MRSDHRRSRAARRGRATVAGIIVLLASTAGSAAAQTSHFSVCTTGILANCADVLLTATPGGGAGGTTLFDIALRNLGSTSMPALPTSIYFLVFGTGLPPAPGAEVSALPVPVPIGGATLADPSPWDLFENGDAVFLSALSNNGVGGCVVGAPVGGLGQAGNTCGVGQYLTFTFSTPRLLDPRAFSVLDLEVVGLDATLPSDSCGAQSPCAVVPVGGVVPEPATMPLLAGGLAVMATLGARRRRTSGVA